MAQKTVNVGLVGFGTVGSGVAKILLEQSDAIAAKMGVKLNLKRVADLDITTKRPVSLPEGVLTSDYNEIVNDPSIDIAVELIGGTGVAKTIQLAMLNAGKDVVTANKALLAEHGSELFAVAREKGRCIAFEASCCGGIPIISALRTGLAANEVRAMFGIVNGTCNYILSKMTTKGDDFAKALKQAQEKGFAESDPTLDICGGDSAHKLAILASLAFGYEISSDDVYVEGIDSISADDIHFGGELGYIIKLLAIGARDGDGRISLRVHPSMISEDNALARVNGSFNAVSIIGSAVGQVTYYGRGAGMMPTASAVVADILEAALGNSGTLFKNMKLLPREQVQSKLEKIDNMVSRFYIRAMVADEPGVFAHIGRILAENQISISGILQHEARTPDDGVPVVITTHPTKQSQVTAAIRDMEQLDSVLKKPVCIRIVDIPEDKD